MQECHDEIEEDDGQGGQVIFRVVRIPFKVAFVTGNLKLRLHVEQDSRVGQVPLPPPFTCVSLIRKFEDSKNACTKSILNPEP